MCSNPSSSVTFPREDSYHIISGERRYHASMAAGLRELPCIEKIADDAETLELALIENLQRKDLTAFEEADGLQRLADHFDYTHDDIAKKINREEHVSDGNDVAARDPRCCPQTLPGTWHHVEVATAPGRPAADREENG